MKRILITTTSLAALALAGCGEPAGDDTGTMSDDSAAMDENTTDTAMDESGNGGDMAMDWQAELETNPLLAEWTGPFGGVPDFDAARLEDLAPAVRAGMAAHLAEIDAIASNPEPPTFENTIVAMERAGDPLGRVFTFWGIWSSNMNSPEFRAIQGELLPELSAYQSQITQNRELISRVQAVYEGDEMDTLRPDQRRVVELVYEGFAHNGALLEGEDAERFAEINARLSELQTQFANNVLHDEENYVTYISEDQLSGLPASFVAAASAAAEARGLGGVQPHQAVPHRQHRRDARHPGGAENSSATTTLGTRGRSPWA